MPTVLKLILAAVLGLATALLVACGGSGRGLIPSGNAGPLKSDFDNVASAVSSGDCAATRSALSQARSDLDGLPATVDPRLRRKLAEGLRNLSRNALSQCAANHTQTTTTTQTTQTTAPPTTTQTTPPPTQTQTTQTTPPPTSTQPSPGPGPPPGNGGGTQAPGGGGGGGNGGGAGANNGGGTPGQ